MSTHAKVTVIAHTAAGMGQVWYRVTGQVGVANAQVAYRGGVGEPGVRRVRFVGAGATAEMLGFRPGELVATEADLEVIANAFTGEQLTHGVKTQRSKLARVPAAPIRSLVVAALDRAGLLAERVFGSRDSGRWWASVDNAGLRNRSVSFLSAAGVLRVSSRAGATVSVDELHTELGAHVRRIADAPVDPRRARDAVSDVLADASALESMSNCELGERAWNTAARQAATHVPVGNAGYELTLTLPKSISLFALTGDCDDAEAWFDVMETAAARALQALMDEAGFCSTGHRGEGQDVSIMPADGWAGFIATEISSRAGDPHLHVHCTLPNVLVGKDGLVRTMADGGRELILNAPRFAAWGQAFVIKEAKARGLIQDAWFDPSSWQWQVGAFSEDTIATFSRGRAQVLAEVQDGDDGKPVSAKVRARRERASKGRVTAAKADDQPSWSRLRADVAHRAVARGLDLATERVGNGASAPQPHEWGDAQWVQWVRDVACEHDSSTSLAKVRALVDLAAMGQPSEERLRITRMVLAQGFERAHESHDRGMRTGGQQWVSGEALAAERWLLDVFADRCQGPPVDRSHWSTVTGLKAKSVDIGFVLSEEQAAAVAAIAEGSAPITLVAGVAGSGKTSVLHAARIALQGRRRQMLVASTATIAAAKAGNESGAPWVNLTALRGAIDSGRPIGASVIVIDEASMADVVSIQRIAEWCIENNRRLVLQGDPAQLGAVAAGDAFSVLCESFPDAVVRLTTNMRQRTEAGRVIADALHGGDVATAWRRLSETGSVVVARNREHKLELLAGLVAETIAQHGSDTVTCDAVTNAEVDELNNRVHDKLIEARLVDPGTVQTYSTPSGDLRLGTGTILRVTKPAGPSRGTQSLTRGQRLTVLESGRDRVRVRTEDGTVRSMTPRFLLAHADYGYAGTTHKVQGQTSTVHIGSIDPNKDGRSLYVTATRARERTVLVADARDWLRPDEMARAFNWSAEQLDDEVLDRIGAHLEGRRDSIDSPSQRMRPAHDIARGSSGLGMAM